MPAMHTVKNYDAFCQWVLCQISARVPNKVERHASTTATLRTSRPP